MWIGYGNFSNNGTYFPVNFKIIGPFITGKAHSNLSQTAIKWL